MKYMILRERKDDYFLKYLNDKNIKNIYKRKNIALTLRYKVLVHLNRRFTDLFFDDWKDEILGKDVIIIFDTYYTERIGELIKQKNTGCRTILYFWNKISAGQEKFLDDKNIDEFWTFDKDDANKYKMHFNPQFYAKQVSIKKATTDFDAVFLGRGKGRTGEIKTLQEWLEKAGLKTFFKVVNDEKEIVDYSDYLEMVAKSRAVVDIVNGKQSGLSLRCMEGLFFGKKVVTNNVNVKKYDFYDKDIFYIIGENRSIKRFIEVDAVKASTDLLKKYTYEAWLIRFWAKGVQ